MKTVGMNLGKRAWGMVMASMFGMASFGFAAQEATVVTQDQIVEESSVSATSSEQDASLLGVECRRYDRDQYQCERTRSCVFDRYTGYCNERYPDYPPANRCERFNGYERACIDNGCSFDYQTGQCYDHHQGQGYECAAFDGYDDYHRDGHRGIGYSEYNARQAALGDCLRHHYRCDLVMCRRL